MTMKYFLTLLFVIYSCSYIDALSKKYVEDFIKKMTDIAQKCIQETHPSDEDIVKFIGRELPTTHEGFCMMFCVHKSLKVQREDGTFNLDEAVKGLQGLKQDDPEIYEKMKHNFEVCVAAVPMDADPCITAKNFGTCLEEEGKKNGITKDLLDQ